MAVIKSLQGAKQFNSWARAAYRGKDQEALFLGAWDLAARQLNYRRGPKARSHERAPETIEARRVLLNVGAEAGMEYVETKYHGVNFYQHCGKAISNAMQDHLRAGGRYEDLTWRGPYDSHARRFRSSNPEFEIRLRHAMDDEDIAEAEKPTTDLGATSNETLLESQTKYRATAAERGAAERTSHDGGHADDERLDPRDDGEGARSRVEGATRGLFTGSAAVPIERGEGDAASAGFMRAEGAGLVAVEIRKNKFVARVPVLVDTPPGIPADGRGVIATASKARRVRGRSWQPKILYACRWFTVRTVFTRGHDFARAVKTNRFRQRQVDAMLRTEEMLWQGAMERGPATVQWYAAELEA